MCSLGTNWPLMRGQCQKALKSCKAEVTCNIFPCYVSILAVSCFIRGCFCLVVCLKVSTFVALL